MCLRLKRICLEANTNDYEAVNCSIARQGRHNGGAADIRMQTQHDSKRYKQIIR